MNLDSRSFNSYYSKQSYLCKVQATHYVIKDKVLSYGLFSLSFYFNAG